MVLSILGPLAACTSSALDDVASDDDPAAPAAGVDATYETHDDRLVRYQVAPEALLRDVSYDAARGHLTITTAAAIAPDGGPLAIEVHYPDDRLVAFVRAFEYPSRQPFRTAALLDARSGEVLGDAQVELSGDRLTIAIDARQVAGAPLFAVSRYLPTAEDLVAAKHGLSKAFATAHLPLVGGSADSEVMTRAVPLAGEMTVAPLDEASLAPGDRRFGPPPYTTNFYPTQPVIQIAAGAGFYHAVDLPSNWPRRGDFATPFRHTCLGARIVCGWFTWVERLSFFGACGPDLDGDTTLDADEIEHYFGYCLYPSATNDTWMDRYGYIHWENIGRGIDAGKVYEYVLDPTTGELGVWYSPNFGGSWQFQYNGPATGGPLGWSLFPPPRPTAVCAIPS